MYNTPAMEKRNDEIEDEEFVPDKNTEEIDEVELEEVEEFTSHKFKAMRAKIAQCESDKRNLLEDLQRVKADFLNSKRRLEEQLARDRVRITMSYIQSLLPLCDSFDMAMADSETWDSADERWRKGIEAIHAQLNSILLQHEVTDICETDVDFNPHLHEAVTNETVNDPAKANKVITILQKGYRHGDTVIRPARVTVGTDK